MTKPNLFTLYENEIGLLTPMVADMLGEAQDEYPEDWFAPAIRIAVERNARSWRYVEAILKRWKVDGFQAKNGKRGSRDETMEEREERRTNYFRSLVDKGIAEG